MGSESTPLTPTPPKLLGQTKQGEHKNVLTLNFSSYP